MVDNRKSERQRCFLRGRIVFNSNKSTIDCNIRNISERGAKLELHQALAVPGEFDLCIPQKGQTMRAKMRWRTAEGMGVEFLQQERAPPDSDVDWRARARELENENAELRLKIADLSARLDRFEPRNVVSFEMA